MRPYLIILYFISIVALAATGDALNNTGDKVVGHLIEPVVLALVASGAFMFKLGRNKWVVWLIIYVLFNIAGFDLIYNWVAGIPIFQVGTVNMWDHVTQDGFKLIYDYVSEIQILETRTSNLWDRMLQHLNPIGVTFVRGLCLWLGVGLIFKFLKSK